MPENKNNPNVLHICKVFLPEKGGIQVVVDWICQGLVDSFNFSILTSSKHPTEANVSYAKVHHSRSYGEIFSLPVAPSLIFKLWRQIKGKEVLAIHYPFPLADMAIALYPFKLPKLVVFWHSEIVSQRLSSWIVLPFTKLMLARADSIVCASPRMIEFSKMLAPYKEKCEVIPYGVPPNENFSKGVKHCPPSESQNFLTIARHVPYKGLHVLIRAFADVPPPFRLTIAGSGPLLEEHKRITHSLGLSERIMFLENSDDEEIYQLLIGCRALVLPSIMPSEAFGLVQIEAMQFGRPVINTNLQSGVPWVARDQIEAITVEPRNAKALTQAILSLTDDQLTNALGINASERAQHQFGHEQFYDRVKNLFLASK